MKIITQSVAWLAGVMNATAFGMIAPVRTEESRPNLDTKVPFCYVNGVDFDLAAEMVRFKKTGKYRINSGDYSYFNDEELKKFYSSDNFVLYADSAPLEDSKKFRDIFELRKKAAEKGIELLLFHTRWYQKSGLFMRLCNYGPEFWSVNYEIYFVSKELVEEVEQK